MEFHILKTGYNPGAYNMALDEALLESHAGGGCPALVRLYGWNPPAVTIGYSEDIAEVVDITKCEERGVDVIRRLTGGGAVLHDMEITYSMIVTENFAGSNVLESFRRLTKPVILGLGELGIEARFTPLNDIAACGKKISGNAQVRRRGCVLQHGTILLGADRNMIFDLLNVQAHKLERRKLDSPGDRIISASEILGREIEYAEAEAALERGFEIWSGNSLNEFLPDDVIISRAETLRSERYNNEGWNRRRETGA